MRSPWSYSLLLYWLRDVLSSSMGTIFGAFILYYDSILGVLPSVFNSYIATQLCHTVSDSHRSDVLRTEFNIVVEEISLRVVCVYERDQHSLGDKRYHLIRITYSRALLCTNTISVLVNASGQFTLALWCISGNRPVGLRERIPVVISMTLTTHFQCISSFRWSYIKSATTCVLVPFFW